MDKPTLLFAEEHETLLSKKLLERKDINVIYLRFLQSQFFSKEYLEATEEKPVFILDKKADINSELNRFKNFLHAIEYKIDHFYNTSEFNQLIVQEFARKLNLKGSLSKEQALWVKDKPTMKDKLKSLGVQTLSYRVVESEKDVLDFSEVIDGFALVVKWRSGLSSIDVFKVDSGKDLKRLNLDYSNKKYMVEKFCPHPVWGIDALVQNGKVVKTFIILLPFETNLGFTDAKNRFAQVTLDQKPPEFKFDDVELTQILVSGMDLKDGYISFEAFIDETGLPTVGELAWRPTGEYVLLNNGAAFGIDLYSLLLDVVTGKKVNKIPERGKKCVGDMFLPLKRGEIKSITNYSDLSGMPGVITGEIRYSRGDVVETKRKYNDIAGWVQVQGRDRKELLDRMNDIYNAYDIQVY